MKLRPFVLLRDTALDAVRRRVEGVVATWREEWGLSDLDAKVDAARAWEDQAALESAKWRHRFEEGGRAMWLAVSPEIVKLIQREISPPDQRHAVPAKGGATMAFEMAEECLRSLSDRLAGIFSVSGDLGRFASDDAVDEKNFAYASGAAQVGIRIGEHTISLLLDHACVQAISAVETPRQAALPSGGVAKSLANVPLTVSVELGQSEVEIAALMALSCGDVIRLNTSVDKPLAVRGPDGQILFGAYLGRLDETMAMEVVRKEQ